MRSVLIVIACAVVAGCASTPEELAATPTSSLCIKYAGALLNPNRQAWLQEVYRRGATCAPYAGEMAAASARAQGTLNSLNQQYAPAVAPRGAAGVTAFLRNNYVQGQSRVCVYDALGSPHIITIGAVATCPLTVQK